MYIPPASPQKIYEDFIEATEEKIQNNEFSRIYITGDFNLPNIRWEDDEFGSKPIGNISEAVDGISNFVALSN